MSNYPYESAHREVPRVFRGPIPERELFVMSARGRAALLSYALHVFGRLRQRLNWHKFQFPESLEYGSFEIGTKSSSPESKRISWRMEPYHSAIRLAIRVEARAPWIADVAACVAIEARVFPIVVKAPELGIETILIGMTRDRILKHLASESKMAMQSWEASLGQGEATLSGSLNAHKLTPATPARMKDAMQWQDIDREFRVPALTFFNWVAESPDALGRNNHSKNGRFQYPRNRVEPLIAAWKAKRNPE